MPHLWTGSLETHALGGKRRSLPPPGPILLNLRENMPLALLLSALQGRFRKWYEVV